MIHTKAEAGTIIKLIIKISVKSFAGRRCHDNRIGLLHKFKVRSSEAIGIGHTGMSI